MRVSLCTCIRSLRLSISLLNYMHISLLTYCIYQDFVDRKLKLVSAAEMFYRIHHDLVDPSNVAVSKLISDLMASVEA